MAMVVLRLPDEVVLELRIWCLRHKMRIGDLVRAGLIDQCRARGIDVAIPVCAGSRRHKAAMHGVITRDLPMVAGGTDTDQTALA